MLPNSRLELYDARAVTAKKTDEWVLNKAGGKRELLDTVKARKLAYYGPSRGNEGVAWRKR